MFIWHSWTGWQSLSVGVQKGRSLGLTLCGSHGLQMPLQAGMLHPMHWNIVLWCFCCANWKKWLNFTSLQGGWHPCARVPAILDYPLEDNTALPHLKVDFMWHTCRRLGMQVHIFDYAHHNVTAWPIKHELFSTQCTLDSIVSSRRQAQKKLLTSSSVSLGETWHNHLQIPLPGCQCQVTLIIFISCQMTVCSGLVEVTGETGFTSKIPR